VTLLPECLDDFIAEDNPVRVVDAFVAELDLGELGFEGVRPADTGVRESELLGRPPRTAGFRQGNRRP
jgi:transposase